ncbi:drug resistance transporter, EmrB/QacA subfamily [Bifidobacterium bohemicum]|uniref:MFS family major facilitator transporter n=1 Tax=Bifidobacterium bohemicum DSM 22767 TaxID=1437606 RepID=A0A086ZF50_9BIFI|nr:DHA2 family efflux MFS transporter permease subunit [Bifidobacterium bohemicum]KFI45150.1 MFS family major facilitator transporter [Bifidobacterium bohemicum DSM 22767]SCB90354.1 drug resistance transporter, EmrB/QacA subfamily [Bifidobacterium bohemicum]
MSISGNTTSAAGIAANPDKIPGRVYGSFVAAGLLSLSGVVVETAMNVTFPTLMHLFKVSTDTVQWLTTANLLVIAVIVPLSAMLKARFRTKPLFITANLAFLAGTLLGALAPNFQTLLLARVIQGVGAGIALPLMFNIIIETAPPRKIGMMMGLGTLLTAVAPAIGPTFGGLVVSFTSWRVIFVCLIPIVLVSLVLGVMCIEQKSRIRQVHFDAIGIALIALTFGALIYGFSSMTTKPLMSPNVAGAIVIGLISLVLLCMRELHVTSPIIDIRTLKNLRFAGFALAFFLLQAVSLGLSFILPNYLQLAGGAKPLVAGLLLLPGAAVGACFAPLGGRILDAIGPKPPLIAGGACAIVSMACLFVFGHGLSNAAVCGLYILYMLGIGMSSGNIMTTGLSHLEHGQQSMGNAIFNTAQQFAGAVGTSVAAAILAAGQAAVPHDLALGTANGATIAFGVLLAGLIIELIDVVRSLF